MWDRLYHFLNGPSPIHPKVWKGRLSPMQFRTYQPTDFERCIEIYRRNEPGRFPADALDYYKQALQGGTYYLLVGERDGQVVCTGGISKTEQDYVCGLCYGLVDPKFHNYGIGTALTLARLSLLNPDHGVHFVYICAVEKSIGFYRRLGFRDFGLWLDKKGKEHPRARLSFYPSEIRRARKLLRKFRIDVPEPLLNFPRMPLVTISEPSHDPSP